MSNRSFARSSTTSVCSSLVLVVCLTLLCFTNPTYAEISTTGDVTPDPTTTTSGDDLYVGNTGDGSLNITNDSDVVNNGGFIGYNFGSTGTVTVDGIGSTWTNSTAIFVGYEGSGALSITNGGAVSSGRNVIGRYFGSTSEVTVDGISSTWTIGSLFVGGWDSASGIGTLNITNGGLVSVGGFLTINDEANDNSFIYMATGGMLAINGDADDSLAEFLGLIDGTDAIRYWDDSIGDWANITGATYGEDYTLSYLTEGDLSG